MPNSMTFEDDLMARAQAELDRLFQVLSGADAPADANIYLGTLKPKQVDGGWARLNVRDDLRLQLSNGIRDQILKLKDRDLVPLEYDAVTEASIGVLPSDFEGGPKSFGHSLPGAEIDSTIKPTSDNVLDQKLRLTRFVTEDAIENIDLFTKSGNITSIRAAHIAWMEKDILIPSENDIFTLTDNVDFFLFGGFYFIVNANAFQLSTNFNKAIEDKAEEGLKSLKNNKTIQITNMDDFAAAVSGSRIFARKLAALQYGGHLDKCTGPRMKSYIESHQFNIDLDMDGEKAIISPDLSTHQKRSLFLSVLAEDIFDGGITGIKHRAVKKVPHKD